MREKYQSIITADGWVICGKCGHKLARTTPTAEGNGGRNEQSKTAQKIEFKCHTCKTLNELVINEGGVETEMNNEQERIEEMAKVIMGAVPVTIQYVQAPANETEARIEAEALIAAGYRKQSDTVREILQKLINNITANNIIDGYLSESIDYSSIIDDIKELAAQYGVEVKE